MLSFLIFAAGVCIAPDYLPKRVWPEPENRNPVVVVLGSSTAAGAGAAHPSEAWAAGLARRLADAGITLLNRSIPGSATAESLARFASDVVPHRPSFVLLTTSLLNENFLAAPVLALERHRANTLALIERVRRIGAVPVLMTMYPHYRFGPAELDAAWRWGGAAEAMGWPVLNFMSGVSEPDGSWPPGAAADGIHPSTAGHRVLLEAVPDSIFPLLLHGAEREFPHPDEGSWRAPAAGEPAWLAIHPVRPLESFTLASFVFDPALSEDVAYFSGEGQIPLRLARRYGHLELWSGERLLWRRGAPGFGWRHLALSYQALTGRVTVAIDGARWGEAWAPAWLGFDSFRAAEACPGCSLAHLLLYRTNLLPHELAALAGLGVHSRGLEFGSPLNTDPGAAPAPNAAQTMSRLKPAGDWRLDLSVHPPRCQDVESGRGAGTEKEDLQ